MKLADLEYHLPPELIALHPTAKRDESRLMVVHRAKQTVSHHVFRDLPAILPAPGLLVRNNTKVLAARLRGVKTPGGAKVEALLIEETGPNLYLALVKPARRLKKGHKIEFAKNTGEIVSELADGKRLIQFSGPPIKNQLAEIGEIPLPPYIDRLPTPADKERYQTVYAAETGSIAAPTAGLHFTQTVLQSLREKQVEIVDVTLHVGLGTFKPITAANVVEHVMDYEEYFISSEASEKIQNRALPLTAVGTTSVRVVETLCAQSHPPLAGKTNLFIYPGYRFQRVNHLLTNFHLPGSTLLLLVAAFAGTELIKKTYEIAVQEKYRFYSYGDAMLII